MRRPHSSTRPPLTALAALTLVTLAAATLAPGAAMAHPATPKAAPASDASAAPPPLLGLRLELGAMLGLEVRQIEAPGRDDTVTEDTTFRMSFSVLYRIWRGLSAGLIFDYYGTFNRHRLQGDAASAWEVGLGVLLRYTAFRYFFVHAGYMFLQLRDDTSRDDLANVDNETSGTFLGSHTVAWLIGFGAQYPIHRRVHLFAKIDYRIRYFVKRGGADLAGDAEYGGQNIYPYVGAAFTF